MVASYESDTIASCFRLFFAVIFLHQNSSLHHLKNNLKRAAKFCGGAASTSRQSFRLPFPPKPMLFFSGTDVPISRSHPWNGPHRSTKKST